MQSCLKGTLNCQPKTGIYYFYLNRLDASRLKLKLYLLNHTYIHTFRMFRGLQIFCY